MQRAIRSLIPIECMPADSDVGRTKPDTQQITAAPGLLTCDSLSIVAGLSTSVGRKPSATHHNVADLALLHASLGHYARQLLDIQKVRIAMANRVAAMERDGLPDYLTAHARTTMDGLAKLEADINRYLERSARRHPMAEWIKAQRGIGLPGFARLLGITGPLDRFATVSKLWAYLGMHVVDGSAPKRRKGELANWSPQGRVLCHQIADAIVKSGAGGPYRAAYDRKKAEYETDRQDWTQMHRHTAAMRYAVKELLKAMWIEWHRTMPAWTPA